eukprot:TRINITY_DN1947_c0_g1_i3.p1 TRINITY_DN1947_c0_g1~~TRINITY_DN1947_c0_g1_i3.p1  ORF type:complete len:334 (-),score=72.37 TRINITY_DN1947_c0_g1_i3:3-899(-)
MSTTTSSSTVNIASLLSACIDLAQQAGKLIHDIHASGKLDVQVKGVMTSGYDDVMTQADVQSQQFIIAGLQNVWPDLFIIGEEEVDIPKSSTIPRVDVLDGMAGVPQEMLAVPLGDIVVYIDPLDATREFTLGNVERVLTLIGISVRGVPVAGVMFQPFVGGGKTFWGMEGMGVHGLTVKDHARTTDNFIATTTNKHQDKIEEVLTKMKPSSIIRVGGAGYKALQVLEGDADVYVFPVDGTKLWDTCAAHAMLLAAGGDLTRPSGHTIDYSRGASVYLKEGLLASLKNHKTYVQKINS